MTIVSAAGTDGELIIFQWTLMGAIYGISQVFLPATDDGFVGPIDIPGFPFGSSIQTQVFVSALICYLCCNFTFYNLLFRLEQMDSSRLELDTTAFPIRLFLGMP